MNAYRRDFNKTNYMCFMMKNDENLKIVSEKIFIVDLCTMKNI